MGKLFGWITGQKVRLDTKGMMTVLLVIQPVQALVGNYALLKNQQQRSPWCVRQSETVMKKGKYCWDYCLGNRLTMVKRPRSSDTHMHCKECSAYLENDFSFTTALSRVRL